MQGDQRTHSSVVALRAVTSGDGMTADWYPFQPRFLQAGCPNPFTLNSSNNTLQTYSTKDP